ncbi:MAG: ParA family protein [Pseudomonadales bacterium]
MEVIAVANLKGGVGKTTSTMSIADALARSGARVLMLDLDPQGSLTAYLQLDPDEVDNTAYGIFDEGVEVTPRETGFDNLFLIPASSALANLEKRAATLKGKGLVLKSWLETQQSFDFVVLDTPPALGMLMINALVACDRLVVPVQTDHLALKGLERMVSVLEMLSRSGRETPYQVLPTMYDQRTNASLRALQVIESRYQEHFAGHVIPVDTKFREASRLGVPPSFLFAASHGVKAYGEFVGEWILRSEPVADSWVPNV